MALRPRPLPGHPAVLTPARRVMLGPAQWAVLGPARSVLLSPVRWAVLTPAGQAPLTWHLVRLAPSRGATAQAAGLAAVAHLLLRPIARRTPAGRAGSVCPCHPDAARIQG